MKKRLLILGASILQLPAIKKAKELGLETIVVDMNSQALGFNEDGIIKEVVSTIDLDGVLEIAKKYNIDGILTLASDMPVRTCAYVGEKLKLNTVSLDTAQKATNKAFMRDCLNASNVPIPKYFKVNSKESYYEAINNFKDKCIVKPADNSGSRGIYLINNVNNKEDVSKAYDYSLKNSRNGVILVEEYMEGKEVSVECLCWKGNCKVIQITDKLTTGAPYFVEMGHNEPSMLETSIKEEIEKVTIAAVNAIGIKNGAAHVEIKVTKEGPKIVELGARLGGDNITTYLVPLSCGVDMVLACIKIALGEEPDMNVKFNRGSAIRYFHSKEGTIKEIIGIEDAKKIDGIYQIEVVHNSGEKINNIHNSTDRVGFVIATANTPLDAIKKCEEAVDLIEVKV